MESKEEAAVERQKLVPDDTENEPDDEQLPPPPNVIIAAGAGIGVGASASAAAAAASATTSSGAASSASALPKSVTSQTPISPVLSHKIFSSGETSRTQDSSNCSIGRGGGAHSDAYGGGGGAGGGGHASGGPGSGGVGGGGHLSATRLMYVNERSGKPLDAKQLQQHQLHQQQQQQQAEYKAKARRIQRDDAAFTPPSTPPSQTRAPRPSTHISSTSSSSSASSISATSAVFHATSAAQSSTIPHPPPSQFNAASCHTNANVHVNHTTITVPQLHAIPSSTPSPHPSHAVAASAASASSSSAAPAKTAASTAAAAVGGVGGSASAASAAAAGGINAAVGAAGNNNNVTFDQRQLKHHSFVSEVPDVRHMERALLGLLEDFHLGKLKAFGSGCTMDQMTDIREQQESLAKLHFELGAGGDPLNGNSGTGPTGGGGRANAQENMTQLVAKLENLSVSIERLHSSNSNL